MSSIQLAAYLKQKHYTWILCLLTDYDPFDLAPLLSAPQDPDTSLIASLK